MVYLDNAATSGKKPPGVVNAVAYALKNYSANPGRSGHSTSMSAAMQIYEIRTQISDFFGASGSQAVVFTANCTHALNCIIKGVLKQDDHIIISDIEHNSVLRPVHKLYTEGKISYDVAEIDFYDERKTLNNFSRLIKPNTKMILCSHASNVCGITAPIEALGRLCADRGILFAVDAAQSAGIFDIDMQKMNIDYLAVAPHKGLYAPMGIGVMIANKPLENTLIEGGTGTSSLLYSQPEDMPEGYESGTVNLPGILGVRAGLAFVKNKGIKNIYKHEFGLIKMLYDHLSRMPKIRLYAPEPIFLKYAPVLSFNVENLQSTKVAAYLNEKGIAVRAGFHCSPLAAKKLGTTDFGTVRVSTGAFNTKNDINNLVNAIKMI